MTQRRRTPARFARCAVVTLALLSVPALALETPTHIMVNRQAILATTPFDLEAFLRTNLGLREGSDTFLAPPQGAPRRVREWVEMGGELEDVGSPKPAGGRFYRHFHDPLQSWDEAGLTQALLGYNESSVRWMQNRNQSGTGAAGGDWSWHDARRMYYQALTEPDPRQRQALLAATFRALGQIMHLVVDASNPDHARNDDHGLPSVPGLGRLFWNYDKWVASRHAQPGSDQAFIDTFLSMPIGFDPAILRKAPPAGEALATVPIARLIDADVYHGDNPGVTVNGESPYLPAAAGLAEISNANFFSENTLTGPYTNPPQGTNGLIPVELELPRRTPDGFNLVRRYWTRPTGLGFLPVNPLRAECAGSRNPRSATRPYPCIDGVVWDQVAAHMLPRAVGYARGVLDYFFRGTLKIHRVYTESGNAFIRIENLGDEDLEGVFELYGRPHVGTSDEGREKSGLVNGGAVTTLAAKATLTFPVTLMPVERPTASQILVFRGRIGLEQEEGVAAQTFTVHHVIVNQTGNTAFLRASCSTSGGSLTSTLCNWLPLRQELDGEFITGSDLPVIKAVSARWDLGNIPVHLEIDGVPKAGGVWQRQGDEPDPKQFRLRPGGNSGTRLWLVVQLIDDTFISTQTAHFINAVTRARKRRVLSPLPAFISIERQVIEVRVTTELPFRTLSLGGYPNPTNISVNRFGDSRLTENVTVLDRLLFQDVRYSQGWIDFAQLFPDNRPATVVQMQAILDGQLLGPPPSPPWEAVVERVYEPDELEFLKTFITAEPPTEPFTIRGLDVSGT